MRARIPTLLCAFALAIPSAAVAQAVNEDTRGESAILTPDGWLSFNAGDASASLSYLRLVSTEDIVWGVGVKGKSSDGTAALFSNAAFSPGAEASFFIGSKMGLNSQGKPGRGLLGFRGRVVVEKTMLYDATRTALDDQLRSGSFTGGEGGLQFQLATVRIAGVLGVNAGLRRTHNYQDLDSVTIRDESAPTTDSTGASRRVVDETAARSGSYVRDTGVFVDADYIAQIKATRFSVGGRLRLLENVDQHLRGTNVGLTFGIAKKAADIVRDRVFAVSVDLTDALSQRPQAKGAGSRVRVSFAASVPLTFLTAP